MPTSRWTRYSSPAERRTPSGMPALASSLDGRRRPHAARAGTAGAGFPRHQRHAILREKRRCAMPSPFAGMDPYLETPRRWLDFHNDLAAEIRAGLNRVLDPRYVASLTSYVAYEAVEIGSRRSVQPDVLVLRAAPREDGAPT